MPEKLKKGEKSLIESHVTIVIFTIFYVFISCQFFSAYFNVGTKHHSVYSDNRENNALSLVFIIFREF